MSLSTRVLLALGAGIGIGLVSNVADPAVSRVVIAAVEPVGTLFVNAIRMTVIPLVVSSLIVGIATSGSGAVVARIGGRGFAIFVVLLVAASLLAAIVSPPVFATLSLDPAAVASLRAGASTAASGVASTVSAMQAPSEWLVSLVPPNAMRAAVDGAMLPLIVFTVMLGLALLSIAEPARAHAVVIFRGITEAMLVLVRWLLVAAPIGVFALTLPLVARLGLSAIGALATYVVLVSITSFVFMLLLYPVAAWGGGVTLARFTRAMLPAQAVAFSSRSSLAALPALIDSARTRLGLSEEISGFFVPLAMVVFRVGAALGLVIGAMFVARLYGISIGVPQLVTIVLTSIVTSFSIPGIPGGGIIAMAPVLVSVGLPIEGIGILLGVDTIPDMFRTTANVTGQLAAATLVGRWAAAPAVDAVAA